MTITATTYGDVSERTAASFVAQALDHAVHREVLGKFGLQKKLQKNNSDTITFRRPVPFSPATTPLLEGVTPATKKMSYETVSATLEQYGDLFELTDRVVDMIADPVLKENAQLAGEQAAETLEEIIYGVLKGGTNVYYAASADSARADVNDPVSLARQRQVVRFLKSQRARAITHMSGGSANVGTDPVGASYVAVGHTDLEPDIRSMSGFVPVESYGGAKPIHPDEVGKVESVRYVLSPLLAPFEDAGSSTVNGMKSTSGASADVYPILYLAQDAFGVVKLSGASMEPTILNPGTKSKSDPLGQRGYVGWKAYFTAMVLNQAWIVRLECGATAEPS